MNKNPDNLKKGDVVKYRKDNCRYTITHIHPIYFWIEAEPYLNITGLSTLYNKLPKDFILINKKEMIK